MALFLPFRALGYITDDVPFAVQRRGKETYITVSVGKSWQVYNASNLRLILVGPQFRHNISALACKGDLTFAAVRGTIIECKRVHKSGEYKAHTGDIIQLMTLGDYLFSLGTDKKLIVWRIGDYDEPEVIINLAQSFNPTCMSHPDTYLNKLVIGSDDGRIQLWNFSSGNLIHEFPSFGSCIRCIVSSPALDVVGIGLADGRALLYNLRSGETIMQFTNAAGAGTNTDLFLSGTAAHESRRAAHAGACTTIAFSSSSVGDTPLMAAGGGAGVVTLWNLEQGKLHTTLRSAHDAAITNLHFFRGEPVFISAGRDNSLKEWILDGVDGTARLLRFRSGHAAPPTVVRHYGDGKRLLSAGQDRAFRIFSTIQDAQSKELSQKNVKKRAKRLKIEEKEIKLARIISLDACDVRERDWSNVITAHENDSNAYVWRLQHGVIGEHVLSPPKTHVNKQQQQQQTHNNRPMVVTSVCLSQCGNFGFVGSSSGRLDRYNMQSGIHRGEYIRTLSRTTHTTTAAAPTETTTAHDGAIYGIASDACNRIVASAGLDSTLRVWNFAQRTQRGSIQVGSPVGKIAHHPSTGLFAAACDDLCIRMFDVEALRCVRRFAGHTDRITDMQLSHDCRWMISSSMDNTLRVWDVAGARTLQVLRLGSPVTSLSLSPSLDLLATTHVEHSGVYLWANQLIFGTGADIIPSEKPMNARLPSIQIGFTSSNNNNAEDGTSSSPISNAARDMLKYSQKERMKRNIPDQSDSESDAYADDDIMEHSKELPSPSDDSNSEDEEDETAANNNNNKNASNKSKDLDTDNTSIEMNATYAMKDAAGTPLPLLPELVTLSMLPRTQWLNLVHIDAIKAKNKPIQPAEKPKAAPFFLPTLTGANAGRNPVFNIDEELEGGEDEEAVVAAAAAAWGNDEDEDNDNDEEDLLGNKSIKGDNPGNSRIVHAHTKGVVNARRHSSRFLSLLHSCADAGEWTSLVAYLRQLSPIQIDHELRSMQLLEESSADEEAEIALFLCFLEAESTTNSNFEFVQALLRAVLRVNGSSISQRPVLRAGASRVAERLSASWQRLNGMLQHVRCMVGLLGSIQT